MGERVLGSSFISSPRDVGEATTLTRFSAFPVSAQGKAHGHVGVIEAHAVCDGFSKLLKILARAAAEEALQDKVRQRDPGQDIYFGRRNRL